MSRVALWLLVGACASAPTFVSSDVRLDGADDVEVDAAHLRMCVSESERVYVVWSDDRTGTPGVYMNRSEDAGQTWLADPIRIDRHGAASVAPDVACATEYDDDLVAAEHVYVVWEDARDGELENRNVYTQRSNDGGATWQAEDERLSDDPDGRTMHLGPRIVAKNAEAYVAWFDGGAGAFDIIVRGSHTAGAEWKAPFRVDNDPAGRAYSAWPDLATDGEGRAYVTWEDSRDGRSDIYATGTTNGGFSWFPAVRLDGDEEDAAGEHDSFRPRIAALGTTVQVVWHDERNGVARDIYTSRSEDHGETWQETPSRVDTGPAGAADAINASVVLTQGGPGVRNTAHVVWQDAQSSGYDVFVRRGPDGAFEGDAARLDSDAAGSGQSLDVEVAAEDGLVVVAWEDRRDDDESQGYNDVYYNWSTDSGETWAARDLRLDNLAPGTSFKTDLALSVSGGRIFAAWLDGRNGTADVYFRTLLPGEQGEFIEVR